MIVYKIVYYKRSTGRLYSATYDTKTLQSLGVNDYHVTDYIKLFEDLIYKYQGLEEKPVICNIQYSLYF